MVDLNCNEDRLNKLIEPSISMNMDLRFSFDFFFPQFKSWEIVSKIVFFKYFQLLKCTRF